MMKILEINIISFGKFSDFKMNFSDGFNIIEGKNESGKSTIQAFIKYILYGLPKRNPNVLIGEREKALSWIGGVASGSMTVSVGEKLYRIERNGRTDTRGAFSDSKRIIDLSDGREVFSGENAGEVFLGIAPAAYDSICNIRQLECTEIDGGDVKDAIENILTSGDESVNAASAIKSLDKERVRLLYKNGKGGLVFELSEEAERLEDRYSKACREKKEMLELEADISRDENQLKRANLEREEAENRCELYEDLEKLGKFRRLSAIKQEKDDIESDIANLDKSVRHGDRLPCMEDVLRAEGTAAELRKAAAELATAEEREDRVRDRLEKSGACVKNEGFGQLLSEYSEPQNVVSLIDQKLKKKKSMFCSSVLLFAAATLLCVFGAYLILIKTLYTGAITVLAIGALTLFVGIMLWSVGKRARSDLDDVMSRLGDEYSVNDTEKIFNALSLYGKNADERACAEREHNEAEIHLGISKKAMETARRNAYETLSVFGYAENDINETALSDFAEGSREYLNKRKAFETEAEKRAMLISSLSEELARYSEKQLLGRITEETEELLKGTTPERLKLERNAALAKVTSISSNKAKKERELAWIEGGAEDPETLLREKHKTEKKLDAARLRLDAVKLASEKLSIASENMKKDMIPRIKELAGEKLDAMTEGKYREIGFNEKMELSLFAGGETRPIDAVSKGSCDVAYLSVRLALAKTVCGDRKPPILMDETFSQLDEEREKNAMSVLSEVCREGIQCILFTCKPNDARIAEEVFGKDRIYVNDLSK